MRTFFSRNFELVFYICLQQGKDNMEMNSIPEIGVLIDGEKFPQWSQFTLTSFHANILSQYCIVAYTNYQVAITNKQVPTATDVFSAVCAAAVATQWHGKHDSAATVELQQ
jgi:hypothetical protein